MTGHRLEVADVFHAHENEFLQRWGHAVSDQQRKVLRDIGRCRTAALGTHLERCDRCSYETVAYDSCRNRHCPKCQSTARDRWLMKQAASLLPVPYAHVVFTVPEQLAPLALRNQRIFYGLLFRAASETLLEIAADPSHLGARIGALAVLHTWSEALRDLVRAREAAKQDQLRARHRLSKFLLRLGQRPAPGVKAWTQTYMAWIRQIRFAQMAQESTRLDYLHELEHMGERVVRLEQAIAEAAQLTSPELQEVIRGLQALRGIAHISAVTIAVELGQFSRFEGARQLMGYSGAVPSEDSSGKRTQRGSITKTGNAHLRRIAVEAAWSYRLRPGVGPALRKRQQGVPEEIKEIAWKAQHRLHKRYCRLAATRKDQRKIITALGRELLGFIWAIGIKAETAAKQRIAA